MLMLKKEVRFIMSKKKSNISAKCWEGQEIVSICWHIFHKNNSKENSDLES